MEHRCRVLQVDGVELGSIHAAAVIERVEDDVAVDLRAIDEAAFLAAANRRLRAAVRDDTATVDQQRFDSYRHQMETRLKDRDRQIQRLEARVASYERSGAYRLGRVLTRAGRSPRALVRLPVDLYGIWRTRRR